MAKGETSSGTFKSNFIYPLIVGLIGTALGWFLNMKFAPPDKNAEALVKEQQNEVQALTKGFAGVVDALNKNSQSLSPDITTALNKYAINVAALAQSTNRLAGKFEIKSTPIDTVVLKVIKPETSAPSSPVIENQLQAEQKITIDAGDYTAKRLSEKSQFAIIKEANDNGRIGLWINHNGSQMIVHPGDQKFTYSMNKVNYYLIYDGKINDQFVFRVVGR